MFEIALLAAVILAAPFVMMGLTPALVPLESEDEDE